MPGIPSNRIAVLLLSFLVLALIWAGRLVYLQVIKAPEYSEAAAASRTLTVDLPARRGTIYDRSGNVLATSVEAKTIYANPKEVTDVDGTAAALAETLGGKAEDYTGYLTQDTTFVYVKRQADMEKAESLRAKGLSGIYFLDDTKRVYPYGQTAGQIVGLVDVDGNGLTGLELYYDDILSGTPGKRIFQTGGVDKNGDSIPIPDGTEVDEPAQDGQDIVISIDIDMQKDLEDRLAQGVEEIGGTEGSAVLMDASSGEILAIASTPYLNPSDTSKMETGADSVKAVSHAFEPGSIFKTVSAMALLEQSAITPETVIDCPAYLEAEDGYMVSDAHERPDAAFTFREIINESSNVGITLAVRDYLGFGPLYDKILTYGLNDVTGIDYPGEAAGYLAPSVETWSNIAKYNLTFGQGISVTPLQMTRFYGALANNGVACTPHLLISKPQTGETPTYETQQIIENTDAIPTMVSMLETVVTDGTGTDAAIDGYTVAGKTGTAEYADEEYGGYVAGSWNLDFTGFLANASLPLVCFVGVDEVPYERNTTAVFHDIMADAIDRYGIVEK